MKNLYLFLISVLLFTETKSQFNSSKYDDSDRFDTENKKIEIYKVKLNDKTGIVDSKGKELIPIEFDEIEYLRLFKGEEELEPLIKVKKNEFKGVLNLKNNYIIPFSNWEDIGKISYRIDIDISGPSLYGVKKGPGTYQWNDHNRNMDTTFLFNQSGNLLLATDEHYNFNSFAIDTCITKDLFFTAEKTKATDYYDNDYDFFVLKQNQQLKKLFDHAHVELWPDKMFYVQNRRFFHQFIEKAAFYTLAGELITKNGNYTKICCETMFPRYQAVELGSENGRYKEGLTFVIDTSGNKLSEGYNSSTIYGDHYLEEDGYFFKIYNGGSITPLCPKPIVKKTLPNNNKNLPNKNILPQVKEESIVKINSFDDIIMHVEKWGKKTESPDDNDEAVIDFNGKNVTGWYKKVLLLEGEYYDKAKNLVYKGGNLKVMRREKESGKLLSGIFSLVANKEILPTKYDYIRFKDNGVYLLEINYKYGLWFQKDDILVEPVYDNVDEYPTRVKFEGKWGKIEKSIFIPF
jgi:hypothetical protein